MYCRRFLSGMLASASLLLGLAVSFGQAEPLHPTGLIHKDLSKVPSFHEVKHVAVAPGAPAYKPFGYVDLLSELPPIGDQGQQGSCTAWGIAYYHKSQLEGLIHHWDLTQPQHQFSPAFLYNQINGGTDDGSDFGAAADLICEQGVSNLSDCPYSQNDCTTWPSESAYSHAIPYRAYANNFINTTDTASLANVKQLLNNGSTCVLAINVWGNFDNISAYNYTYCASDRTGYNRGGHAVCIVGYDDTMTTHDGPGAFKLVNSWGTGWGVSGVWWMSYQAVLDTFLSQRQVVYLQDTCDYQPTLLGRVQITHQARDRVGITLAAGPRSAPLWSYGFRTWRTPAVNQPFPNHNIVFDMSAAAPYIATGKTDSLYVSVIDDSSDSESGAIGYFSAQYLPWQQTGVAQDTPATIPAQGAGWLGAATPTHNVGPVAVIAPAGTVDTSQSVTPEVKVRNFGSYTATFPVKLRIGNYYRDSAEVTNLLPGESTLVTFSAWTALTRGATLVRCTTAYSADQVPADDTLDGSVSVRVRDVGFVAIVSPPDTVDTGVAVTPQATVKNFGTTTEMFILGFNIPGGGYGQTVTCRLAPGNETTPSFPVWTPHTSGTVAIRCTVDLNGDQNPSNNLGTGKVTVWEPEGIAGAKAAQIPAKFSLESGRPNPFHGALVIRYGMPVTAPVRLAIYSTAGTLVRVLRSSDGNPGFHEVVWDGRDDRGEAAARGVYLYRLDAGRFTATREALKLD